MHGEFKAILGALVVPPFLLLSEVPGRLSNARERQDVTADLHHFRSHGALIRSFLLLDLLFRALYQDGAAEVVALSPRCLSPVLGDVAFMWHIIFRLLLARGGGAADLFHAIDHLRWWRLLRRVIILLLHEVVV